MKIYSLSFLLLVLFSFVAATLPGKRQEQKSDKPAARPAAANIIFKSTDGGQTWQDISEGLPGDLKRDGFIANDNAPYLLVGNGIYHGKSNSKAPFWEKEIFPDQAGSIAPGKSRIFAYNYREGQLRQKLNGSSVWSPVYANFEAKWIHNVFETAGGAVFICCDRGLFISTDNGKNWKQVPGGDWQSKIVESNGVLMATGPRGIIRSTDDGENWETVISEGGVGFAVEVINAGFAAITFNTRSETRRVRTSYDGGKSWQAIDAGLPASPTISSIIQVGDDFFCGHPRGIMRSSDKGKTWKLIHPSIGNKVFKLSVSGGVIYAIPRPVGC
jgi:photosystem II stability/assembly factor-like uncharacterized protein